MTLIRNEKVERALDKRFRANNGELEAWKLYEWGGCLEVKFTINGPVAAHDYPCLVTAFQKAPITRLGWQESSRKSRGSETTDGSFLLCKFIVLGSHVFLSRAAAMRTARMLAASPYLFFGPLHVVPVSVSANDLVTGGRWHDDRRRASAVFMKHLITAAHLRRGVRVGRCQDPSFAQPAGVVFRGKLLAYAMPWFFSSTKTTPAIDNPEYAVWVEKLKPRPVEKERVLV